MVLKSEKIEKKKKKLDFTEKIDILYECSRVWELFGLGAGFTSRLFMEYFF